MKEDYRKDMEMKPSLHVEVVQRNQSRSSKENIKSLVHSYISNFTSLIPGTTLTERDFEDNSEVKEHVEAITFCDVEYDTEVSPTETPLAYHVFKLGSLGAETDSMADAGSGEEVAVADVWALPARDFHGLWQTLVYDSRLKEDTVRLVETAFEFAERRVDPHLVGWNRVVLLHGPPGTGKTSLCRALAHKLAARFGERFPRARLLEINAHGLFSKWFAESGKLVSRLFARVRALLADPRLLLVVLVDEVESLAAARRSAAAGCEPSDAIRAVNALLTELDRLRAHGNALVLATSNVTGAIDAAFADRADIKRRVGPPTARAAYEILRGCCAELAARGLLAPRGERLFPWRVLENSGFAASPSAAAALALWAVARDAAQRHVSARALRRLPLLARALHAPAQNAHAQHAPPVDTFVAALHRALHQHLAEADQFLMEE